MTVRLQYLWSLWVVRLYQRRSSQLQERFSSATLVIYHYITVLYSSVRRKILTYYGRFLFPFSFPILMFVQYGDRGVGGQGGGHVTPQCFENHKDLV